MTELYQIIDLQKIIQEYGLTNLIETGCNIGDGIKTGLSLGLKNICSCDLNIEMVKKCNEQFVGMNVKVYHGYSTDVLPEMCRSINGRTLFWLDAHLPASYDLPSDRDIFPAADEIKIIKKNKQSYELDVIIVDDTRAIKSKDNPRFDPEENICCEPVDFLNLSDFITPLVDTHECMHVHDFHGYLIFLPKKR